MDLAGRHTSLHPNSATLLSPTPLNYSVSTSMQMVSIEEKPAIIFIWLLCVLMRGTPETCRL